MRYLLAAALIGGSAPALAQTTAEPVAAAVAVAPVAPVAPALRDIILPPNSEVIVTPVESITTKGKALKQGSTFRISTVLDVMHDGYIVIPKGTVGEGTVSFLTSKGAFGKSGKMEVTFNSLEMNGRMLALGGTHRQEGEGNTGAAVGAAVAVGVFSVFVTGRSASILNGQQLRARTLEPITFQVPENAPRMTSGTLAPMPAAAPAAAPAAEPAPAAAEAPAAAGN